MVSFQGERKFVIKFNEKVVFSVLESIAFEKQMYFVEIIQVGKRNGELMLMV